MQDRSLGGLGMRPGFVWGRRQAHVEVWMEPIGCGVPWGVSCKQDSTWTPRYMWDEVGHSP